MNIPKKKRLKHNPFKDIHEKMSKKEVNSNMILKVQSIAMDLEMFENAYIAPIVHKQIVADRDRGAAVLLVSSCADIPENELKILVLPKTLTIVGEIK